MLTPIVTIGVMPPEVEEGTSAGFTIDLSEAASAPVVVGWETVDGSATAGDDYQGDSGTVTFQPGELSKNVSVLTLADDVPDPDETFSAKLTSAQGATIDPFLDEASVTIIDVPPEGGGGGGGGGGAGFPGGWRRTGGGQHGNDQREKCEVSGHEHPSCGAVSTRRTDRVFVAEQ